MELKPSCKAEESRGAAVQGPPEVSAAGLGKQEREGHVGNQVEKKRKFR